MKLLAFEIYRSEYPSDRLFFSRALIRIELGSAGRERTSVTCTHQFQGKGIPGRLYGALVMRLLARGNVRNIVQDLTLSL